MAIQTRQVEYNDGDILLEAYMAWDDSSSNHRPGVLVSHAWAGRANSRKARPNSLPSLATSDSRWTFMAKGSKERTRNKIGRSCNRCSMTEPCCSGACISHWSPSGSKRMWMRSGLPRWDSALEVYACSTSRGAGRTYWVPPVFMDFSLPRAIQAATRSRQKYW